MRAKFGLVPTAVSNILSFKFISRPRWHNLFNMYACRGYNIMVCVCVFVRACVNSSSVCGNMY